LTRAAVTTLTAADERAVLTLNNANAVETSWLDQQGLRALLSIAFFAARAGTGTEAFIIALDQNAEYANPNFSWFRARYGRFVYVDRVVTAAAARGRGHARDLYDALAKRARRVAHELVVCEVNLDPPNPTSDRFHAALGFREVGRATLHDRRKEVRYLAKAL
jgi:uncharacterized protein